MKLYQIVFILVFCQIVYSHNYEKRFWKDIMEKVEFNRFIRRPMLNNNKTIKVVIEIALYTILSLNMKDQVLKTSAGIKLSWTDEFMKWNSSSDINAITVSSSDIWKPDVRLMNNAGNPNVLEEMNKRISIYNGGQAEWRGFVEFKTYCFVDTTRYPFDTQICKLNFSAENLDYKEQELTLRMQDGFLNEFRSNGEWNIAKQENVRTYTIERNLHGKSFSGVVLEIKMDRLTTYYEWRYIVPTISLVPVVLLSFLLPVETNTKIALSTFIVLSYSVLIQLFNESLPTTSENICCIGQLLSLLLAWSGGVLIENVAITFYYNRGIG